MRLKKIYEIADEIAPFAISRAYCAQYKGYDNSGILVDCGRDITRALFSLDLSAAAAERAKREGAQLIVTHHPAIYTPVHALTADEGANVLSCAMAGISVLSAHLNLDMAPGGIDDCLMHGLGGETALAMYETPEGGAYGRVYEVEERSLDDFSKAAARTFCTGRLLVYGDRPVRRVASFCGAGMNEGSIAFAAAQGADTFVSSDAKHHLVAAAVEAGMNVLLLTHYAAENYGFRIFAEKFEEKSGVPCIYFADERLL